MIDRQNQSNAGGLVSKLVELFKSGLIIAWFAFLILITLASLANIGKVRESYFPVELYVLSWSLLALSLILTFPPLIKSLRKSEVLTRRKLVRWMLCGSLVSGFVGMVFWTNAEQKFDLAYSQTPEGKLDLQARAESDRHAEAVANDKARGAELDEEIEQVAEAKTENLEKLEACIGFLSRGNLENAVKERLRDPESFSHINTSVKDANFSNIEMEFRAANGFGGLDVGRAYITVDPDSCDVINVSIQN